jgi:hypothetical protein
VNAAAAINEMEFFSIGLSLGFDLRIPCVGLERFREETV